MPPELRDYFLAMQATPDVNCTAQLANQSRPTSAELGLSPWDPMDELESLPTRIAFLNQLTEQVCTNRSSRPGPGASLRVAAYTVWMGDTWGLRRALLPWLQWHTQLGVCRFYVAFQGTNQTTLEALRGIASVRLILFSPPFADPGLARDWEAFAVKYPRAQQQGNSRLMALQNFAGRQAVALAQAEGQHWLAHIDADELLLPATTLQGDLDAVPEHYACIRMLNHESLVESVDVVNKIEEVTLFKTNENAKSHVGRWRWDFRIGTHSRVFMMYYNGKPMVRTDRGKVWPNGPHDFQGEAHASFKHPKLNPRGKWPRKFNSSIAVLHLTLTNWQDVIGKARVSCPPEYREAALAGNRTKLSECLLLNADREAYTAAARGEEAAKAWWMANCLLSEGSVRGDGTRCRAYRGVRGHGGLIDGLTRHGVLHRILAPQQTLRAHELAIRALLQSAKPP
ncbi:hypothetical protein HYH03_005265 [Edaphochlamys debaryana]|uniref:Glycosyltransferase family 92 protein n=1 Tax=Edaphochlamys debaryana TaxID=47281 RepID=A0A835Y6E7_9CHLO|nr:hypothetical protein HYH03_005265 [Edaphochlamys debaryana]|eukprot:KAG2496863.1 hypothetical protein HYH03_005265 [Edaphochlamys debaryana]